MKIWALQDAKARLSELVRAAEKEPQVITLHGVPKVEVRAISEKDTKHKIPTLLEALQACPKDADFELPPRPKERMRKIDLRLKRVFLLDTCLLSEGAKAEIDPGVASWLRDTSPAVRYVSVLSLAEVQYGIRRLPAGKRRDGFARWYDETLRPIFDSRVLPFEEADALAWAKLRIARPNSSLVDSQLAATAIVRGLTVITRNVKDFDFEGVAVFNPWRS